MEKSGYSWLKGWRLFFLCYAMLLVASHLFEGISTINEENEYPERAKVNIKTTTNDSSAAKSSFSITYRDIYRGTADEPPVILLMAGGPEGSEVFDGLISELADKYRLLIPDLPGHGTAHEDLPDYSFRALSIYTSRLLNSLDISEVHVVGYGLGGASAIHLAHNDSNRVNSVSLVSSIGVQELQLLGSYTLNHAIHGIQVGIVWLLHNAVPHFGLLNSLGIDVPYAKSYYESDQRPIRRYLKEYQEPMLIIHGREDGLVPLAAANEHHRIVPQSKLIIFEGDHGLIEERSKLIAGELATFLQEVEEGEALARADASKERLQEARKQFENVDFARFKGISLLIIVLIIILSTFISEDLTCIGAGLLAARGLIGFWSATGACLAGIFIGDVGLYLVGRYMGRKALQKSPFKWFISEQDLEKSSEWFRSRGPAIIMASRFLPGSRLPTYFSAGVIGAGFWMFIFYFLLSAIIWTPLLVGLSMLVGNELLRYFSLYQDYALWVFIGAIVLLVVIAKLIIPAFSYRGRRLLVSRYRRLTNWKYWHPVLLNMPVFFYVIYLGIKYRSLTLFTAANPGVPVSDIIGESKRKILDLFSGRKEIVAYEFIPGDSTLDERTLMVKKFIAKNGLPVVLKPNFGNSGKGVTIVRAESEVDRYLNEHPGKDLLVQQYVPGREYEVFYYRYPDSDSGNISSITKKRFLSVTGDGTRTVEELILDDDKAVELAKVHLKKHEKHLYEIPEKGEVIPLVELGTHARGAIFEDGSELRSYSLREKMDKITGNAGGFYFGKFDIRVPEEQSFKAGKYLKITEVNGVSSNSTNIYDDKYSFMEALKILKRQWDIAFKVGAENVKRGCEAPPLSTFIRIFFTALLLKYRK